jgi:Glutamine synthetase, catalytic domain/Glutamine synthetase, beta-Grasp domain
MGMIESRARATSDPEARREVLAKMEESNVEYVLFWFTDLEGHLKSFAITLAEMAGALDDGMGFDGSSITGFNAIEESDMVAMPDPATFRILPAAEGEPVVGRLICDIVKPDGEPYEGDPRQVLRRALERMTQMGFDTFNVGPELEYFLFKDSAGTERLDEGGYFAMTALDAATDLRYETIKALEAVGIPIEYHHHEVAPSQHEIDMRFAPALDMADFTMTYRLIVKEVAARHGVYATFMPKPLFGENGSGMHTHMSLFKDGRNQFFAADESYHLSPAGKQSPGSRRPCTPRGRSGTAPRSCASRCTSRARSRGRAPSSAAPTRRATRTSRSRRCCTQASRGSHAATSCRRRWRRTCTTSQRRSAASAASSRSRRPSARRSTSSSRRS